MKKKYWVGDMIAIIIATLILIAVYSFAADPDGGYYENEFSLRW